MRIRLETEAKLVLQQKVREGACELVWSAILDYENAKNPFEERSMAIRQWRDLAVVRVMADAAVIERAAALVKLGIVEWDALHVASAIVAKENVFVTTDDRLLKSLRRAGELGLLAAPPGAALAFVENWYED